MSCCIGIERTNAPPLYRKNCPLLSVTIEVIKTLAKTCLYLCAYLICQKSSEEYKFHWLRTKILIDYYWEFGNGIVNFSVNRKKLGTLAIDRETIEKSCLVSADRVKPLTMKDGVCYGAAHDFISRFFYYQNRGFTIEESVKRASSFFTHGGTKEAVLMQMIQNATSSTNDDQLLNYFHLEKSLTKSVSGEDFKKRLGEEIVSFREGAYHISLKGGDYPSGHSIALIKGNQNDYYLFEPNGACVKTTVHAIMKHIQHTGYEIAYFYHMCQC